MLTAADAKKISDRKINNLIGELEEEIRQAAENGLYRIKCSATKYSDCKKALEDRLFVVSYGGDFGNNQMYVCWKTLSSDLPPKPPPPENIRAI
jgi:hypothetical protein